MSKLAPKQARFVEEYLIDLNATQAAIRAGYKNGEIGRQIITKNNVLEAIQAAEAKLSGEGSSHSARVAAWAHLGKHLGMFVDKTENKTEVIVKSGLEHFYDQANT